MADLFDFIDAPPEKKTGDIFDSVAELPSEQPSGPTVGTVPAGALPNIAALRAGRIESAGTDPAVTKFFQEPIVPASVTKWANPLTIGVESLKRTFPESTPVKIASGITEGGAEAVAGLTSPQNLALLPLAAEGAASKGLGALFAAQAASQFPEEWKEYNETNDPQLKAKILTRMAAGLGIPLAAFLPGKARAGEVPKEAARFPESVPAVEPRPQSVETESLPRVPTTESERIPSSLVTETARLPKQPVESRQASAEPITQEPIREAPSVPSPDEAGAPPVPPKEKFTPSTEWQEVPPGTVLPNGGEYRMDQATGKNYARWTKENLPGNTIPRSDTPTGTVSAPEHSASEKVSPQSETTPTSEEPSRVGIAHEYGEERFPGEIERGTGTNVETQVARGRELLERGVDPDQIVRRVQKTGRVSGDDMSVLRAKLETLQFEADTASEAARTNPGDPVLQRAAEAAMQNELAWRKTIKPAATAFHEIGMTLQGQAEVNYGTFEGLRRSAFDLHGKDVNPAQAATLKEVANRVRRENQLATESLQRATTQVEQTFGRKAPPRSVEQLRTDLANRLRELTPC